VRYDSTVSARCRIKFMTNGVLLREVCLYVNILYHRYSFTGRHTYQYLSIGLIQVRYDSTVSARCRIKFMPDRVLLREVCFKIV